MTDDDRNYRNFLERMKSGHEEHLERLQLLAKMGHVVGSPTLQDSIDREALAITNISQAIEMFDYLVSRRSQRL